MCGHALLQGIFPTQGLNLCLLHCRQILYHLKKCQLQRKEKSGLCWWGWGGISHMGRGLPGRHCPLIEINSGQRFILGFLGVLTPYLHHTVLTPGKAETPQVTPGDPSTEREPKQAGLGAGMGLQQEVCLFRWISCITDT